MATLSAPFSNARRDVLSGTPRVHAIDRWIYVAMAAWFILIVLVGFVPDSLMKIAALGAGVRPAFPPILHVHAVLMGSFLILLLAQTTLVALGRTDLHTRLGMAGIVLAPALVVVGFMLVPVSYQFAVELSQTGSPAARKAMTAQLPRMENILLMQSLVGTLFTLFIPVALLSRGRDDGLHKRMMILATAVPLTAAFARMPWLPTTLPASPVSQGIYVVLAISPMLAWDVFRNRFVHRAYWIWLGAFLSAFAIITGLWDTDWWHATARSVLGPG